MKAVVIAICCVSQVATAWSEILPIYRPVPSKRQIVVTKKGQPAAGVSITFNVDSRPEAGPYWSGSTDASGRVSPLKLPPGKYRISADADERNATLYVDVREENIRAADLEIKLKGHAF